MNKQEVLAKIQSRFSVDAAGAEGIYNEIASKIEVPEYKLTYDFWQATQAPEEEKMFKYVDGALDIYANEKGINNMPNIDPNPNKNDLTGQTSGTKDKKSSITKEALARPQLTEAAEGVIQGILSQDAVKSLTEATRSTSITKLLLQRPNPSSYLKDAKGNPHMVVPEADADKLAEWEKQLVDDPDNIKAFQEVKAAVLNKTAMPVYINDDGNKRVVGCLVNSGGNSLTLTIPALKGFLLSSVLGRIVGSPGVYLSKWEEQKVYATNGAIERKTTTLSLKWAGRDTAIKAGMCDCITQPANAATAKERGYDSVVDGNARVRIEKSFVVSTTSTVDGVAKTVKRTKRLTGKTNFMPHFVLRKEFINIFPETRRKDTVDMPTTPDELQKALENIDLGLSAVATGAFKPTQEMLQNNTRLADIVANIRQATTTAGAGEGGF